MTDRTTLKHVAAALALIAAIATGAEAQTASPASAGTTDAQRYRLVEVAGSALPVEVEKEWRCRESVTRGALTLESDSVWTFRSTVREECGDRAEVENEVEHGRFTSDGTAFRFYDDDEDDRDWELRRDLDLDDFESGTLAPDGTLTVRLRDGETTLVFRR